MSQQEKQPAADAQNHPRFEPEQIYIKDSRFHASQPAELFRSQSQVPALQIQLHLDTKTYKLTAELYEVALKVAVTALPQNSQTAVYQAEVSQAGLFAISNYGKEDFEHIVNVSCPSMLFPYARQVLSGLIERAGFPSMVLAPMNFEILHKQYQERLQQTNQAPVQPKH
ncbi:MAG TPA: protein-export chaperone SecB [Gammaproteobacteria bacterium]|nr:protein-export chaperone SecB [Gammaproteobacteria bacterium]